MGISFKAYKWVIFASLELFLLILVISNLIDRNMGLVLDRLFNMSVVLLVTLIADRLHQDKFSYSAYAFAVYMHNLYLYGSTFMGLHFDHYMHVIGGFAIGIMTDRYVREKTSAVNRLLLIVFVTMGVGAFGEVIEWLGYSYLGQGDGFFLYGLGDFGEWRNAVLDMINNAIGAFIAFGAVLIWPAPESEAKINGSENEKNKNKSVESAKMPFSFS